MSYIQFDEDQMYSSQSTLNESSGLIALIQKLGLARDNRSAQYVLIGIVCVIIVLTILIVMFSKGLNAPHQSGYVYGQNVLMSPRGK